jgi:methylmalonyl-CoA carboxyltransferase large subunit
MNQETVNSGQVADALAALRLELARLGERVAALEAAVGVKPTAGAPVPPAAPPAPAAPAPVAEGVSEEIVVVIAAAVAAFLGKKAPIRQIRLLGSAAWAQQGRVTIQASHALEPHPTRR